MFENTKTKNIMQTVWDYLVMVAGCFLYCASWECFMIPNNWTGGGLTGLCTILNFASGGFIPVSLSYVVGNVLLLLLATLVLGKSFGIKTIFCIGVSTVFFQLLNGWDFLKCMPGEFLYVSEPLLIPIIGGILEAVGIGIIFLKGGSTGGYDIIILIVNKFWPVSPGRMFMYLDTFTIALILLLPGRVFSDMIFGYIFMIASALTIDFVMLGKQSSVQILVFSEKYQEIADYIINELDRGVTTLKATGWFTKSDKEVLLLITRKSEMHDVTAVVKHIDPKAFVSVTPASGVYGEGFEEIKTGLKKKFPKKNLS